MSARRQLLAAGMVVSMAVLAGSVTPAVSVATPGEDRAVADAPLITVAEIRPPQTSRIEPPNDGRYQMDDQGTVLLQLRPVGGGIYRSALWQEGTFEVIDPPEASDPDILDLSDQGRFTTGRVNRPPCEHPWWCPQPLLWHGGETTLLPTDGLTGTGELVDDRGRVVVGQLHHPCESGVCPSELVGWADGQLVRPPVVGDAVPEGHAVDLNNSGQAILNLLADDGTSRAAVWDVGGEIVDLGTAGGVTSAAVDINDRGDVVGWWSGPTSGPPTGGGFLWRDGEMILLDGPMSPEKVNDRGQVVGRCPDPDGTRVDACLWDDGELIDLGTPEGLTDGGITPVDINDHGQVIGIGRTAADRVRHAFLWLNGQTIDLGAVAGTTDHVDVYDINDQGQIIGRIGEPRPYLAPPPPVLWTVH